jgi:hypothetical protein
MRLIPAGNLESAEPVLAIRWCIDRAEAKALKDQNAENIHILFVIAYEGAGKRLEDRCLVPIDQVMTYLNFRRPGTHKVFARIVSSDNKKTIFRMCLDRRNRRSYDVELFNYEGTELRDVETLQERLQISVMPTGAELGVVVPSEHFPKEPPIWVKRLVNAGFGYPPIDQCDFRRRMLFCPIKLPVLAMLAVLITTCRALCALVLSLRGMRGINFAAVIHPWRNDMDDVYAHVRTGESWFVRDEQGVVRPAWFFFLQPILWLVIGVVLTVLKLYLHMTYLALIMAGLSALSRSAIATWVFLSHHPSETWKVIAEIALIGLALYILAAATVRKHERADDLRRMLQVKKELQREQSYDNLYKLLACNPSITPTLSDLPTERQTLRLRYLDLKAKVCRPFAAS